MLCSVYTTIAGEYCDPPFCTPIGLNNDAHVFWYILTKQEEEHNRMNNSNVLLYVSIFDAFSLFIFIPVYFARFVIIF